MTELANARLTDATNELEPADRALLNLWIHRGLDDAELAKLIGSSPEAIASRRSTMVTNLSVSLGLPPEMVLEALKGLAPRQAAARPPVPAEKPPVPAEEMSPPAPVTPARDQPAAAAAPPAPAPEPATPRRRRALIAGGLALLCAVIIVIVLLASGGGHTGTKHAATASASTASTAALAPTGSPAAGSKRPLTPLPGGQPGLTGTLTVRDAGGSPQLSLAIRGLRPPGRAHYELWLYNTVIDARPLATIPAGGVVAVTLPAGYRRFRWLDVSLQPAGAVRHSGISILRSATPA